MEPRKAREQSFHNKVFSENVRWQQVRKFYSIVARSQNFYGHFLEAHSSGKNVLEYGCGPGGYAFALSQQATTVTGIDISDVAIQQAEERARSEGLDNLVFQQMDAEMLKFDDDTFDLICGTGILHHLELEKAFSELSRTLRADGYAIFMEPLGHNFLVNLYRKRTPNIRTEDEHPLLVNDLELAPKFFGNAEFHYFHFFSLAASPFRKLPGFHLLVHILEGIDQLAFKLIPPLRRQAWIVVIVLSSPHK